MAHRVFHVDSLVRCRGDRFQQGDLLLSLKQVAQAAFSDRFGFVSGGSRAQQTPVQAYDFGAERRGVIDEIGHGTRIWKRHHACIVAGRSVPAHGNARQHPL